MARYIDAEEFFDGFCIFAIGQDENFIKAVETVLEDTPTADVAEVKHGYWKEYFSAGAFHYDCSNCDYGFATKERAEKVPNYCENCGAKMDGGKEE